MKSWKGVAQRYSVILCIDDSVRNAIRSAYIFIDKVADSYSIGKNCRIFFQIFGILIYSETSVSIPFIEIASFPLDLSATDDVTAVDVDDLR